MQAAFLAVTVRNKLFTGCFEENTCVDSSDLFPLEHEQITGWRWRGLSSLLQCLMRKVLILTVTVDAQQKELQIESEVLRGHYIFIHFLYLFKAASLPIRMLDEVMFILTSCTQTENSKHDVIYIHR